MSVSSSSTSAFVSSLLFNGAIAIIFLFLFIHLRPRNRRVYEPRTLSDIQTIREEERTEPVPSGYFKWASFLLRRPQSYLIQHASIDGYLFLRFVGISACLTFASWFILFPILLPVNATGGLDLKGFELLSMANVTNKNRYYAHVFLSWIWFALLIFIIYRELYYYVIFRHALQTTPLYDGLLSSRTIILAEIKSSELTISGEIEKIFPKASGVLFARDNSELIELCQERAKDCLLYEKAMNKMLGKAVKMKLKADKDEKYREKLYMNGKNPANDLETYIPHGKRPKHRINPKVPFLKFTGEKVSTIRYLNDRIPELNEKIHDLQEEVTDNDILPTCFIKFDTQLEAQRCYQALPFLIGKESYGKRFIGYSSEDILYENLKFTKKERKFRRLIANTFLTLMIIFWAIPVAVVGCISNISFLTDKIYFLRWINNLPNVLLGLITGIVPSIALAFLMSLVPPVIKKAAKMSGAMTSEDTELYCHKWYFAFQVIQVFLVTTGTSSASSTVIAIINDPSSAMTLLAKNLPKSANFYISYFLVLGLTVPTGSLLQVVNLILSKFMGRIFDNTPRQKWLRYNTLSKPSMGIIYPTIEIILCISISYSVISSLVLVFSTTALFFLYFSYLYNFNYVFGFSVDMKGRNYPRAILQIFVGIYLAEICLLGLFIMSKNWGCTALEAVFLCVTPLFHIYFKRKFIPLIDCVPISAIRLARGEEGFSYPYSDLGADEMKNIGESKKKHHEENITGGIIRPATRRELEEAHVIPRSNDESSSHLSESPVSEEERLHLSQSEEVASETQQTSYEPQPFSRDKKKSERYDADRSSSEETASPTSNTLPKYETSDNKQQSLAADQYSKVASTFVSEEEQFRKWHFEDIENLQPEPIKTKAYEYGRGDGLVPGRADIGYVYSDQLAMTNDPKAYPRNLNRTFSWPRRILHFFQPSKSYPFERVRRRLPHALNMRIEYNDDFISEAYFDPSVTEKDPIIWICKDSMGLSEQQISEAKDHGLNVSSDFTQFNEKGSITFTFNPPDFEYTAKK
ncbi:hypothetical protein Kpol_1053p41 [Vanderwaltozyma polyspora DSM 70294]|uniref:Phosphate metabolism protein 7 n=1 Tax=Vanderwaltozyma polyspora (strain ATCC 22028 / DSM 70294 / BCRC 21397 / CBS 2163 / NBRC 10782 / NRRL Y-8283 / UCD 57-17) TaxID=436907 RepID=A7TN85_VANPO|nr:uncharacterized protein Kpol_1053p41 [Vanderwaltozyma polyspora DSM 70294]EDO16303.1 hypothetical protein Kpol_1053p41 [Vanderwaltozyma polyspora DSM 70294]